MEIIGRNPASAISPPKVETEEMEILTADQVSDVLGKLRGTSFYPIAVVGLGTGMRRGELLALRWADVDLDAGLIRVERSLEQTKAGLRFKAPKTKHGRRAIKIPAPVVATLRSHRKAQLETRMKLGLGRLPDDALVFPNPLDGSPRSPRATTKEWSRLVKSHDLPRVSLHALRHSHASALIAAGKDALTVSRRLGHASPVVTLAVYGHLFRNTDEDVADTIGAILSAADVE